MAGEAISHCAQLEAALGPSARLVARLGAPLQSFGGEVWENGLWEMGLIIRVHYPSSFLRIGEFAAWDIWAVFLRHVSDLGLQGKLDC